MGQEGELFLIFIAFFAIVVVFELVFLLLSLKKIKKDASSNLERLKSVIVGFLVIILFGVLEALELFGLIHLYPYVPSLLGIGTIVFGLIMLRLALFDFREKIKELRFLDSLLDRLGKEKKEILDRLTLQYSEFNENLNSLKESFIDAFHVPSLSMQYINEIIGGIKRFSGYYSSKLDEFREVFEKFKNYKEVEKEVVEFDINEFLGEIGKKYREFENLKNRIKDVKSYETAILENFSAFSGNTDKFDSVFTQVFSLVEKLDELIERLRIVSINTEIVSYKKSIKESSFLESVSSEILDKVSESKVLLRLVLDDLEKLRSIGANLKNDVINSVDIIMSAINDLDSYVLEFEPPEEYKLLLGNIYSGIVNMLKYTQVIVDFVNTLEHFVLVEMKEFNDNLKVVVALGSEVFYLQSHLSDTVKMLGENIYFIEEVLKNRDFLSLKNSELKF
jgi:predicted nuclease with TOPRIM domain